MSALVVGLQLTVLYVPFLAEFFGVKAQGLNYFQKFVNLRALGASGIFLYNICFLYGLRLIEAGRGALVVALTPAVVAAADCDVGLVGYEMALLVEKAGAVLTPELRAELQSALPR